MVTEDKNEFMELVSAIESTDRLVEDSKRLKKWSDIEKTISKIVHVQQTMLREILTIRRTLQKKSTKDRRSHR